MFAVTATNVHDKHLLEELLHGEDRRVYGDSAYASQKALIREHAPHARDFTCQRIRKRDEVDEAERSRNRNKSQIRARGARVRGGEAVVGLRYRGFIKNANRSLVALGWRTYAWRVPD